MKKKEVIEALTKDGNLHVPCSRYGSDSADCAKVAYRMTKNMEYHGVYDHPVGIADYEANMSLIVNDHDDVAYILKDYKIPRQRKPSCLDDAHESPLNMGLTEAKQAVEYRNGKRLVVPTDLAWNLVMDLRRFGYSAHQG